MIHPQELRIGNFLQLNPEKQWIGPGDGLKIVESISEKGINYTNYPESGLVWQELDANDLSPIPLTEEWLIKFGFEKKLPINNDNQCYSIEYEGKILLGYWLIDGAVNIGEFIPRNIKYVHQLQNLIYALTGSELTIKE